MKKVYRINHVIAGVLFPYLWNAENKAIAFYLQHEERDVYIISNDKCLKKLRENSFQTVLLKGAIKFEDGKEIFKLKELKALEFFNECLADNYLSEDDGYKLVA